MRRRTRIPRRMRRRIRSAAFPVHRHSVPQLVVDGVLVALAYYLAFQLRFEGAIPSRYQQLLDGTIWWVVPVTLIALAGFGLYQRLWSFVGPRDYEAIVKGVIVSTAVIVGAIALLHPVTAPTVVHIPGIKHIVRAHTEPGPPSSVLLPVSVIALFTLLTLAALVAPRFAIHLFMEGR